MSEFNSWGGNNLGGYTTIKLTLAGYRLLGNGVISNIGNTGLYWSSTIVNGTQRNYLYMSSGGSNVNTLTLAHALSVRCIKDL